jgi:cytochrome oxidase Cu insertion factor (SCO1/SenC/PrrC family)
MKRIPLIAALALSTSLAAATAPARKSMSAPPRIGQQAPDFTAVDQNGKTVHLSDARGHKVVLVFYRGYW